MRFATVGAANTLLTLIVITLALQAGAGDFPANALGYVAGLALSYLANRHWTFGARERANPAELLRYLGCFAVAYGANLAMLALCRSVGLANNPLAHLPGMVLYTLLFFALARQFAFGRGETGTTGLNSFLSRHGPEAGLAALALLTFAKLSDIALTHDVAWQFWIARQMLAGATLYADIWEVNPPLWFWSAVPIEWIGQILGISARPIIVGTVVAMGAVSALLLGHLADIERPVRRFVVMAGAFWFCVPMPLFDFGQREQLVAICSLPYIALIARRAETKQTPFALTLFIGLFAAYGFALKHYFVLVPVLLELWLVLRQKRAWWPLRPETLALGTCGVAYAGALLLFTPSFLTIMLPMLSASYHGYEVSFLKQVDEAAQIVWLIGGLALLTGRMAFGRKAIPLVTALVLAMLAFMAAYFAQRKGWQYHAVPVTAMLTTALLVRVSAEPIRNLARHPLALLAILCAMAAGIGNGSYNNYLRPGSGPYFDRIARGEAVAVLSADPMWAWPISEEHGLVWPLRLYSYWMLPAIGHDAVYGPHDPRVAAVAQQIHRQTLADLRCKPPAVILIERRTRYEYQPARFDVGAFFLRDPGLRAFMAAHYHEEKPSRHFRAFWRQGNVSPTGDHCREIAPLTYSLPRSVR